MRTFYLMLACWLVTAVAFAQALPASPSSLAAQAAPETDTVAAIHRLFAAKRHQSGMVISGTVAIGLLCLLVAEDTRHSSTIDPIPVITTGISLFSIPATIKEILYYRQFTHRKEARALSAFKKSTLPDKIKQQLQPAYFEAEHSR